MVMTSKRKLSELEGPATVAILAVVDQPSTRVEVDDLQNPVTFDAVFLVRSSGPYLGMGDLESCTVVLIFATRNL